MKHIFLSIVSLFLICGINAESINPQNAKLQKVTVYVSGAHMYYSESVTLKTGNNEFIFENISPFINEASLQASCKNGVITEVKHQLIYIEKPIISKKYDKEIVMVLDSIEDVNFGLQDIKNKLYVLETEKTMLLNNRIMKGQQLRDSLALLRDGLILLRERLNSIYEQNLKLEKQKSKLNKKLNKLNERYKELVLLQSGQNLINNEQAKNQIVVNIFSEINTNTQVLFNYFVSQASWIPQYDLQASSVTGNLNLKYFASLTQNTGIQWNNVYLTLSTSNPSENNIKPILNPWFLSYQQYLRKDKSILKKQEIRSNAEPSSSKYGSDDVTEDADEKYLTDYITMTENLIRTEYEIAMKYTISSDAKSHKVMINQKETGMNLKFATVPKICTDAFLLAKITGWEEMNILPGMARVYFDGSYVGETYLNSSTTQDTLDINLGRDKSIAVSRNKIKEKSKIKFINDEKIDRRTIEIIVKNTKNIPIDMLIEDQIPVVKGTNEIKVKLISSSNGELDENSGILKWDLKLKAKEQVKIKFEYEISYPKDKIIVGL
ncbi:MAG: DUF4139 domain-containing protein [Bacteroidia bacterium]|nr:DUF4139 domain-containing protein [Bacteroidia bacterium]